MPTNPRIFAAGDCATIPGLDLDKVGVHAVKQGPLWASHAWLLRLKHWIDQCWVRRHALERWSGADGRTLLGVEAASAERVDSQVGASGR